MNMHMKMSPAHDVQHLLAQYWAVKRELTGLFPNLSGKALDDIAKMVGRESHPARTGNQQGGTEISLRDWVYLAMGQEPMRIGDIYDKMVGLGWDPTKYADARGYLGQLLNQGEEFDRTGYATYCLKADPDLISIVREMRGSSEGDVLKAVRERRLFEGINDIEVNKQIQRVMQQISQKEPATREKLTLKEAICRVLGDRVMSIGEVYEALKSNGWLPNSNKPRQYIGETLAKTHEVFQSVPQKGRGFYQVAKGRQAA